MLGRATPAVKLSMDCMPAARQTDTVVRKSDVAGIDVSAVAVDMQGRQFSRTHFGRCHPSKDAAIGIVVARPALSNQKSGGLAIGSLAQ